MTHIVFLRCKMLFTHAAALAKEPFGAMSATITHPRSLSIPGKRLSETKTEIERNAADGLDGGLLRGTPLMLVLGTFSIKSMKSAPQRRKILGLKDTPLLSKVHICNLSRILLKLFNNLFRRNNFCLSAKREKPAKKVRTDNHRSIDEKGVFIVTFA